MTEGFPCLISQARPRRPIHTTRGLMGSEWHAARVPSATAPAQLKRIATATSPPGRARTSDGCGAFGRRRDGVRPGSGSATSYIVAVEFCRPVISFECRFGEESIEPAAHPPFHRHAPRPTYVLFLGPFRLHWTPCGPAGCPLALTRTPPVLAPAAFPGPQRPRAGSPASSSRGSQ